MLVFHKKKRAPKKLAGTSMLLMIYTCVMDQASTKNLIRELEVNIPGLHD